MKITEVKMRTPDLIRQLLEVWEGSVRATHLFLSEDEINHIKEYVPQALDSIAHLVIAEDGDGRPVAFMGVEDGSLEMLFIAPQERGKGLGKRLLQYGIENYGLKRLAVNEQNPQAKGFYEHMGFQVYKRTELDEQGNPYPLLYMSLAKKPSEKKYRAVFLDVDGTLLDFNQAEAEGMKVVLKAYGFEPTKERLRLYHEIDDRAWAAFERGEVTKEKLVCQRFVDFFGRLGKMVDGAEAEALYRRQLDASAILIDGAPEVCAYLAKRYDLYVVTNGTSSTQYKRLAASGLDRFMKDIFVSEDAGSQKPRKEYFDYCFRRMPGILPQEMILVGDSLSSDILGGNQAGTDTCWYNPAGLPGREDIRPDYEIRDLRELEGIL